MKERIRLTIQAKRVGPVLSRHPWVFSGALKQIPDALPAGTPVELTDPQGRFLAAGYFNTYSQIAVRIWSYQADENIDIDFFTRRIRKAWNLRKHLVESAKTNAYRLIYGEGDLLPGLVVDKYADYLSIQFHTKGMEAYRDLIVQALKKEIPTKGIYERSDTESRKKEDTDQLTGLLSGEMPDRIQILENGLKFWVDVKGGQKTGFFLDQRDKRLALKTYASGKEVLNCFSYTGGFSVYALAAGAKHVTSVDISEPAVEMAKENMKLNDLPMDRCDFVATDVKQFLYNDLPRPYDLIILDPPAFIKDRRKKQAGMSGYRKINELALKKLPADGYLVSCSCSHHISGEEFRHLITECAGRSRRTLQFLDSYGHGPDHNSLMAFHENAYLKVFFTRVWE